MTMSESIYHWIKEVIPPAPKQPMYHSKHDPLAKPYAAASTFSAAASKKEFGSIGREVKAQVARPLVYTKAHERSGPLSGTASTILPKKFTREDPPRKPTVPKREDAPLCGLKSGKDFVVANAVDAILTIPKRAGASEPPRLHEEYARVPEYLKRVKQEIEDEHEYIQSLLDQKQMEEEAAAGVHMRELTSGEREELIEALKKRWDDVNHEYQKTTFKNISTSNSSIGEIRRKELCERQLVSIEKDVARLSVKAPIFVVDDAADGSRATGTHGGAGGVSS